MAKGDFVMKRFGRCSGIILVLLAMPVLLLCGCKRESSGYTPTTVDYVFRTIDNTYVPAADSFAGGDGSEKDPYRISDASELAYLSELINDESLSSDYRMAHYVLTEDIVLNEDPEAPEYAWMPIGVYGDFKGVFDGDGHVVTGMYVNEDRSDTSNPDASYGLFGENRGIIKNLTVKDSYVCVSGYSSNVGGIAGQNGMDGALIENCSVEATVFCYDAECGGIVGKNSGVVDGCSFAGELGALREDGQVHIGGIVGYNSGDIESCTNAGSVHTAESGLAYAGGIVADHTGGTVSSCENTGDVSGASYVGGIAGNMFLSDIGGQYKATACELTGCINRGAVTTGSDIAGGIVGSATNDHSDYVLSVTDCANEGRVESAGKTGGVVGLIALYGPVAVTDCSNSVDLEGETVGGIVASASYCYGSLSVSGCTNTGSISAGMYAAGIIAENNVRGFDLDGKPSLDIAVSGCANAGDITTGQSAGGIVGVFACELAKETCEKVTLTIEDNESNADILCNSTNAFVGGIAGNLGIPYASTTVSDCSAEGTITFADIPADEETLELETGRFELNRIAGGIVGRIGSGLYLSSTGDNKSGEGVNGKDANIRLSGCTGSVRFDAPDEGKYVYEIDGTPVFLNRLGGIVGYYSGADGYAFSVKNCEYSNASRGLGDTDLPDVGTKV